MPTPYGGGGIITMIETVLLVSSVAWVHEELTTFVNNNDVCSLASVRRLQLAGPVSRWVMTLRSVRYENSRQRRDINWVSSPFSNIAAGHRQTETETEAGWEMEEGRWEWKTTQDAAAAAADSESELLSRTSSSVGVSRNHL